MFNNQGPRTFKPKFTITLDPQDYIPWNNFSYLLRIWDPRLCRLECVVISACVLPFPQKADTL
jgi:hypothetical protein